MRWAGYSEEDNQWRPAAVVGPGRGTELEAAKEAAQVAQDESAGMAAAALARVATLESAKRAAEETAEAAKAAAEAHMAR